MLTFAADGERENVKKKFAELIEDNDMRSFKSSASPDGRNLNQIKEYFEKNKLLIDINDTGYDTTVVTNPSHKATLLQIACAASICSWQVVEFLCQKGALSSVKAKETGNCYPTTLCIQEIVRCGYSEVGLYDNQYAKLGVLKQFCKVGESLKIDPSLLCVSKQFWGEENLKLLEGTVVDGEELSEDPVLKKNDGVLRENQY
jgi:hypothetical protein